MSNSNLQLNNVAEAKITYSTKVKSADRPKITSSRDAVEIITPFFDPETIEHHESCWIMLLNRANRVLGVVHHTSGGISGTLMDVGIIFQSALLANAKGLILFHNHPSGKSLPSDADIHITRKLREGGKLLDIEILDHIIITPMDGFYSMADMGWT